MSRSRTRPVSEKPLVFRGPPPPPVVASFASSTTSLTPGPDTASRPTAAPPARPGRRPASSAPCAAARSRRRAACPRCPAARRPRRSPTAIRSMSSCALLGQRRRRDPRLRGTHRHHERPRAPDPRASTSLACSVRGSPGARPRACAGRRLGVSVVEAVIHDVGQQRHGRVGAPGRDWGAPIGGLLRHAAHRRTSRHCLPTAPPGAPERRWTSPVRHVRRSVSATCAVHDRGPFVEQCLRGCVVRALRPQMGDRLGRVGQHHHPAAVGLHHPHTVGGVDDAVPRRLHDTRA